MLAEAENRPFVVPDHGVLVRVDSWPLIKLIREVEHFAVEKWTES